MLHFQYQRLGQIPTSLHPLQQSNSTQSKPTSKLTMTDTTQQSQLSTQTQPTLTHHLLVCTNCGSQWINGKKEGTSKGEKLLEALQSQTLDPQFKLKPVVCMSGCSHACVIGLLAPQKTTYVFGDLDPSHVDVIVQTAQLYLAKPDGILPWAERPLKQGIIARIPPVE